uniref:Uncharacterized protein n=1 Tax=Plectus sambesii TaxID=2011161 RepID=A0A914XJL7_9BILA
MCGFQSVDPVPFVFTGTRDAISNASFLIDFHLKHLKEMEEMRSNVDELNRQLYSCRTGSPPLANGSFQARYDRGGGGYNADSGFKSGFRGGRGGPRGAFGGGRGGYRGNPRNGDSEPIRRGGGGGGRGGPRVQAERGDFGDTRGDRGDGPGFRRQVDDDKAIGDHDDRESINSDNGGGGRRGGGRGGRGGRRGGGRGRAGAQLNGNA